MTADQDPSITRLRDLGEREIIRRFMIPELLNHHTDLPLDDCAIISLGIEGESLLISTDAGPRRPFLSVLGIGTDEDLGAYFAEMAISDIAAMGGIPIALVAAFLCPATLEATRLQSILKGFSAACAQRSTRYVGGDTKESESLRVIVTVIGKVETSRVLRRRGASPGDVVCVSNKVGQVLATYIQALELRRHAKVGVVLRPTARVDFARALSREALATSCMDMSDGPVASARELAQCSGVAIALDIDKCIAPPPAELGVDASKWRRLNASNGADFELMFTVPADRLANAQRLGAIPCGRVVAGLSGRVEVTADDGSDIATTPWEHFRTAESITTIIEGLR